jgi:hypothetical protein
MNEVELHAQAWDRLCEAEQAVNAAKELLRPRAVSPAKARLQRYPATPTPR